MTIGGKENYKDTANHLDTTHLSSGLKKHPP